MLAFIGYSLAFVLIGLLAGLASRKYMPGRATASSGYATYAAVGIAGALVGGVSWLALRWTDWNKHGSVPEGAVYAHVDSGQTQLPGYWIGLIIASVTAVLTLAVYKLMRGRKAHS